MLSKIRVENGGLIRKVCNERRTFLQRRDVGNLLVVKQTPHGTPKDVRTGRRISKLTTESIQVIRLSLSNNVVGSKLGLLNM